MANSVADTPLKVALDANPFARFGMNGWEETTNVTEQLARVHTFEAEDCEKALALPPGFLKSTVLQSVRLRLAYLKKRGLA